MIDPVNCRFFFSESRMKITLHNKIQIKGPGFRLSLFFVSLFFLLPSLADNAKGQDIPCLHNSHVLGMSTVLSGPVAHLGINMRNGVLAALKEINVHGGIQGKSLCLVVLNDGYDPERTVLNMHRLIEQENVLAVIGNVGTPTAIAAVPIANRSHVPFFGALTGAGILRRIPPDHYVINYRASYAEETAAMVQALITYGNLRPNEIAFFTQRDAYGDSGFVGGMAALKKNGLKDETQITHGRYERNSLAVENSLADILLADPEPKAIIMVGTYAPSAKFIRLARNYNLNSLFLNVSFVGAAPLAQALGDEDDGVIVTQVVPPLESSLSIVQDFHRALHRFNPSIAPTYGALEGYISTRIFLQALKTVNGEITRESIIEALENLGQFDLGFAAPLKLSSKEHQASHQIWPTIIRKGEVQPFDWKQLRNMP
jgi:ABC-type branched-subunit amino acid transport system substrate-binding protein